MKETTKEKDQRLQSAYDEWSHEVEATFRPTEIRHDDTLETIAQTPSATRSAQDLNLLEGQSKEFFDILRETVDEDNDTTLPKLDIPDQAAAKDRIPTPPERRHLSPAWLAAAVVLGFVIGYMMPKATPDTAFTRSHPQAADSTTYSRSLAEGDVNTALLVSL